MGDEAVSRTSCERLSRNGWWLAFAASPLLGALGSIAAALAGADSAPLLSAPLCAFIGVYFMAQVWRDNPAPRRSRGRLTIGPDTLSWDDEMFVRQGEIHRVSYHHEALLGTVVRLHRKRAMDLRLLVKDDDAAPIPIERFERLIEDASAGAVDRAAAAVAIGRIASPEQRQRIRTAAQQTVDPTLRIALSRAAEDEAEDEADDEALAEALVALEKRRA